MVEASKNRERSEAKKWAGPARRLSMRLPRFPARDQDADERRERQKIILGLLPILAAAAVGALLYGRTR
jgi:hypothetical protein